VESIPRENIFIFSADWTVKMCDHTSAYPLLSFDVGFSVGDVSWSPYSSTLFSTVSSDGKVFVFDLSENKHGALCEQKIVKKAKLTKVRFNTKDFVLIVGDDHGAVNSLKLSPNLRKSDVSNILGKTSKKIDDIQRKKVEDVLATIDLNTPNLSI